MATPIAIFTPSQRTPTKIVALASLTSSIEIPFGIGELFAINADQDITIRFGPSGLAAADATFFRIPQNVVATYDAGTAWTSIRVFNLSSTSTANIYIQPLSKV
jgi:hypothetical protein